ncbi:putative secreted protein (Por secretion system target) [Flavobacterium cauense R2A-7]|uniref:Putative secreted protein (Por secretion system target) n=2 Tax=Flavobacterium TaxID=237 RepID=A0A562LXN9_9FLAO|nr:putative secreted protein (Por secretion system target) [Flavobacterium cauense R2A-7]
MSMAVFFVNGYSQSHSKQKSSTNRSGVKKEVSTTAPKKIAINKAKQDPKTIALRKQHAKFLANSPFKKNMALSGKERKAMGIPPNKYYEMEWELTMDPTLGRPTPENLAAVRKQLAEERRLAIAAGRTPGDGTDNNWVERGPNNVGGRVRALMFDPNDATYKTVFAGGVSGGLWKNTDITNAATVWTRVNIPENLAVSAITYDPNNTNVFYVGTGESYVGGDVNGDGVWKSTNGGTSWTKVFGGITGPTTFESAANLTINSPAGVAGNYACYPTTAFGTAVTVPITSNIVLVDDGTGATSTLGCNALTNGASVSGKIALIRRGSCTFVQKVLNAQDAGAIGVIMMNNIDGTPVAMGGTDPAITIPSIMISKADGDILQAAVLAGTVNGTLNPSTGPFTGNLVPGKQHINDIKVRNNGGNSEIYVAAGDSYYAAANAPTYLGGTGFGLFRSVDGGANWTEIALPLTANGNKRCPNDIEIGADGKVWVSSTHSVVFGDGGGKVYSSSDGVTFTEKFTVTGNGGGARVQIEASATNANKIYVLSELDQATPTTPTIEVALFRTTDGFATAATALPLPPDNDSRSATYGFTGAQAFYNLMIESDPANDQIVYVGGLNIHRSTTGGNSWSQITDWMQVVHSDQHAMAFRPTATNSAIFGNDGGIYYAGSLSTATTTSGVTTRNNGLNITQFYSVGVAPTNAVSGLTGEYFAAGAQDNGTQYFAAAGAGVNASVESQGGDGAFTLFDQGADKYYISNYVYNNNINLRPIPSGTVRNLDNDASTAANGAFIAPMVLDSSLDILYADYSSGTSYLVRRYKNIKSGVVGRVSFSNALLTSPPTAFAVSPYTTATTTLLVGTRLGKLFRVPGADTYSGTATTTGTWVDITGPGFVGSISDVEYGANNNEIFVTMHNYNVVSIWYTKDGGATWSNKEGNFPDIPVKAIMRNPLKVDGSGFATEVIIGTELGVWYSNNFDSATPTWRQSYNGMSNVKVVDLDLRNDNTVFAATYGRGLFSGLFTNTTLSSDEFAASKGIKMYPNPTKGQLNIAINNYSGKLSVSVFDLNGRQVYTEDVNDFNAQSAINMSSLQKGVYVVKVNGDNLNYNQKVILD